MDSLFSLLEGNNDEIESNEDNLKIEDIESSPAKCKTASKSSISVTQTTVKEIKGIRTTKNIKPLDSMEEELSSYDYHSTQQLISLSRNGLNALTGSNKSGKTNISTIAIVFRNSGTKLSKSNGSAFSIFSIGSLSCGPIISLFLFGDAYSKYTSKSSTPHGTVLAVIAPSILPSKAGSEHALTLAVYDQSQIIIVGTACDYGVCQQRTRDNKRCSKYVDLRKGKLCATHAKCSQHTPNKSIKNTNAKSSSNQLSFVQKLRMDNPYRQPKSVTPTKLIQVPNRKFTPNTQAKGITTTISLADQLKNRNRKRNDYTYPDLESSTKTSALFSRSNPSISKDVQMSNRYPKVTNCQSSIFAKSYNSSKSNVVAKQLNTTQRKSSDYSGLDGYDGHVRVPKPCSLLSRAPARPPSPDRDNGRSEQAAKDSIIEKQRQLAMKIKIGNQAPQKSPLIVKRKNKSETSGKSFSSVFQSQNNTLDIESLASKKSIFASEVEAEQYAKSRQIINGLEKKEEFHNNGKRQDDKCLIERVWICGTCDRTFRKKPVDCIRGAHNVKLSRSVKQSVDKKCKKDVTMKENGLILGQGLEWDKRRYVD